MGAMLNKEATDHLLQILGSVSSTAMENRHALMALVAALKEQHPQIYQAYEKNLGAVQQRGHDQTQIAIALEHLRELLQKK